MKLELDPILHANFAEIKCSGTPIHDLDFDDLHAEVDQFIGKDVSNIVLNLEGVDIINSLGLNALIKIMTKCRNAGGDLHIVNISEKINHVLLLTKLNTVLNIASSVDEVAEGLNSN